MGTTIWQLLAGPAVIITAAGLIAAPRASADPPCPNYPITGFCAPGDRPIQPSSALIPAPDYPDDGSSPVMGGGPVDINGQRIIDQLPTFSDAWSMNGRSALGFATKVMRFNPQAKMAFSLFDRLANCTGGRGLWAARGYAAHDLSWGGGVALISENAWQQAGRILLDCVTGGEVSGGGPGGSMTLCTDRYEYSVPYADVTDTYLAFVFGLPSGVCSMIKQRQTGYA